MKKISREVFPEYTLQGQNPGRNFRDKPVRFTKNQRNLTLSGGPTILRRNQDDRRIGSAHAMQEKGKSQKWLGKNKQYLSYGSDPDFWTPKIFQRGVRLAKCDGFDFDASLKKLKPECGHRTGKFGTLASQGLLGESNVSGFGMSGQRRIHGNETLGKLKRELNRMCEMRVETLPSAGATRSHCQFALRKRVNGVVMLSTKETFEPRCMGSTSIKMGYGSAPSHGMRERRTQERRVSRVASNLSIEFPESYSIRFSRSVAWEFNLKAGDDAGARYSRLEDLHSFLGMIYLCEPVRGWKLSRLSTLELNVLDSLLNVKRFEESGFQDWMYGLPVDADRMRQVLEIKRDKRKEERNKIVVKNLFKALLYRFETTELDGERHGTRLGKKDRENLFYLFYFSEVEFGQSYKETAALYISCPAQKLEFEERMNKYTLPDFYRKNPRSDAKTINKDFVLTLSNSKLLSGEISDTLMRLVVLMCGLGAGEARFQFLRDCEPKGDLGLDQLTLFHIVHCNDIELSNMFKMWLIGFEKLRESGRLGQRREGYSGDQVRLICAELMKVAQSKNFKLPWSLAEIRDAYVETFLWFHEYVYSEDVSQGNSSKGLFFVD